jgi:hypothetical protein
MEEARQPPLAASDRSARRRLSRRVALIGLVVVAAVVGVVLLLTLGGDETKLKTGVATEVSAKELRAFARDQPRAVYWAGETPGFKLELTRTRGGNVYVRYLPEDVSVGDRRPIYTTIGSYPMNDAFAVATDAARERGASLTTAPGGGIVVVRRNRPKSAYVAFPGSNVLIEVYADRPDAARRLARSGRVGRVE